MPSVKLGAGGQHTLPISKAQPAVNRGLVRPETVLMGLGQIAKQQFRSSIYELDKPGAICKTGCHLATCLFHLPEPTGAGYPAVNQEFVKLTTALIGWNKLLKNKSEL